MNKKDLRAFNSMLHDAWNDDNAFCRKMKQYILDNFKHVPELQERCEDPYWKKSHPLKKLIEKGSLSEVKRNDK